MNKDSFSYEAKIIDSYPLSLCQLLYVSCGRQTKPFAKIVKRRKNSLGRRKTMVSIVSRHILSELNNTRNIFKISLKKSYFTYEINICLVYFWNVKKSGARLNRNTALRKMFSLIQHVIGVRTISNVRKCKITKFSEPEFKLLL